MARERASADGSALLLSRVRRSIVDHLSSLHRLAVEGRPTRDCGLTAAELGEVLGLHSTTARFHLDQLVAAGLVGAHSVRSGGVGRPAKRYFVVEEEQSAVPAVEGPYQVLAGLLAAALDPAGGEQLSPEEAGVEWVRRRLGAEPGQPPPTAARRTGEWVAKVGTVVDLLQEWGYTPDLEVTGRRGDVTLTLTDCPFLDLARERPEVVCGVHRGLLKGALEVAGEESAGVTLRPFTGPRTCRALLLRGGAPAGEAIVPGPGRWAHRVDAGPQQDLPRPPHELLDANPRPVAPGDPHE